MRKLLLLALAALPIAIWVVISLYSKPQTKALEIPVSVSTTNSTPHLTDDEIRKQNEIALPKLRSNESFDPATWTIQPVATRDSDGGTIIAASTNIPDGVKIWVQLTDGSTSKIEVFNGKFSSEAFSRKGNPIPAGSFRVTFLAYFNESWQQPASVLEITGNGGRKLKGKLFHKVDQDVVDSDVMLEYSVIVDFPPLSRDQEAISLVKSSILVVNGSRSSETIGKTVEWFLKPGTGIKMGAEGWKAIQRGSGIYEVQLYISDASNDGPALWEADLRTRKVKYINKIAKDMSYLPPD